MTDGESEVECRPRAAMQSTWPRQRTEQRRERAERDTDSHAGGIQRLAHGERTKISVLGVTGPSLLFQQLGTQH